MADKILLKRSATADAVPSAAALELGELAINTADGVLYFKKSDGTVVALAVGKVVAETATTAENYSLPSMIDEAAFSVVNTWAPQQDALSVVPTAFFSSIADTTNGDMVGASHQVSTFNYHVTKGGGTQATQYGQEFRVRQEGGSRLGEYVAAKHVIEPTSSNSGTQGRYVLEQFDDMRGYVTHVEEITREFLDPRMLTVHAGGELRLPLVVTGPLTLTDAHSGKDIFVVSATDVAITVPATLADGVRARVVQVLAGRAVFNLSGMTSTEPEGLLRTQGQGMSASLVAVPSSALVYLALEKPEPVFSPGIQAGRVYGAIGRNTLLAPVNQNLSANILYAVPISIPHRTTLAKLGVRVTTALAGKNLRLCLFSNNKQGLPGARLYQSANLSTGTIGEKQVAGLDLALEPGIYFVGVVASGAVQVQFCCTTGLEDVFGRPSGSGTESMPVWSYTITTVPADLTAAPPALYVDPYNYAPDVWWGA